MGEAEKKKVPALPYKKATFGNAIRGFKHVREAPHLEDVHAMQCGCASASTAAQEARASI